MDRNEWEIFRNEWEMKKIRRKPFINHVPYFLFYSLPHIDVKCARTVTFNLRT